MAIKYIDMELGRNKPVLNPAYAFNPTGTVTRIYGNGVEHGLTTGEQVVLTNFTAWLNGTWTITVFDEFSFDLDTAVWAAASDNYGISTPVTANANDGSTWALATKGELNVSADDTVYVAKSPDPVSLGQNVTFTNLSNALELTTPVTLDIDQANVNNWTAVSPNSVALLSTAAYKKLGSGGIIQITKNAAFTAPGKMAYRTLPSALDLSGFTKISFYFGANSNTFAYFTGLKICLCSDTIGDTIVDEFVIPALQNYNTQTPFVLTNGVALGSNINSVAIYMLNTYTGAPQLRFNHIFACNDVTLHTLISKTNTVFSEQLAIQSITGTQIIIDEGIYASNRGYYGTTETLTPYIIQPIRCTNQSISFTANTPISLLGGINKTTGEQDGETWLRNATIGSIGTVRTDLTHIVSNFGFVSASSSFLFNYGKFKNFQVTGSYIQLMILLNGFHSFENIRANNNTTSVSNSYGIRTRAGNPFAVNKNMFANSMTGTNISGIRFDSCDCYYEGVQCCNNSAFGLVFSAPNFYDTSANYGQNNYFLNVELLENNTSDLVIFCAGNTFNNIVMTKTAIRAKTFIRNSPLVTGSYDYNVNFANIDGVRGANRAGVSYGAGVMNMGYATWQTAIKQGNDPGAWECHNSASFLKLAEIAVTQDIQITIRAWVSNRISGDTGTGKLIIRKRNNPEIIAEDLYTNIQAYTLTWQEVSITFTPLETGIVVLEFFMEYIGVSQYVYIGSITMS